MVNLN